MASCARAPGFLEVRLISLPSSWRSALRGTVCGFIFFHRPVIKVDSRNERYPRREASIAAAVVQPVPNGPVNPITEGDALIVILKSSTLRSIRGVIHPGES